MKSTLIRKFYIFFIFALSTTFFAPNTFATDINRQDIESDSTTEYQLMLTEFKHQKLRGELTGNYPDYYAGAYIDSDGELTVLLTNTHQSTKDEVAELTRNQTIKTAFAVESYNVLEAQSNLIFNTAINLRNLISASENLMVDDEISNLSLSFIGCGIDEEQNKVVVSLTDTSTENISAFKKYISNYSRVYFEKSEEHKEQTTVSPGTGYTVSGATGSIGYRSRITSGGTTVYGFTTAGHASSYIGQSFVNPSNNTTYGTALKRQYSGTVDATFVQLTNSYSVSNVTTGGAVIGSSWFTSIPQGKTVYMCGTASYGNGNATLEGTVKNNSYSFVTSSNVSLSDQLRIYYGGKTPRAGDSGGIVYAVSNGTNTVVGIHQGVIDIVSGIDGRGIATKAHNVYLNLGVVPY